MKILHKHGRKRERRNLPDARFKGKKLGIIGLGAIGVHGGKRRDASGHGSVLGYDPYISVDAAWNLSQKHQAYQ